MVFRPKSSNIIHRRSISSRNVNMESEIIPNNWNKAVLFPVRKKTERAYWALLTRYLRQEEQSPITPLFLDLAAAFDSINRTVLWRVMERGGEDHSTHKDILSSYIGTRLYLWGTDRLFRNKKWCSSRLRPFPYSMRWITDIACRRSRGVQISPEHRIILNTLMYSCILMYSC